jgi:uncharacterized membrane protein
VALAYFNVWKHGVPNVFDGGDVSINWNGWALIWSQGLFPTASYGYPQFVPTLWAVTYIFMGSSEHYFAFYIYIGLITIIGLAAKDAILIIEFAKDLRAQGKPLIEATVEACALRFRPILMTGLAFVCGVLPMVVATGAGGASQQALGTSVMGGMIAVVILALLMVPVFFVTVQRFFARDRETVKDTAAEESYGPPAALNS